MFEQDPGKSDPAREKLATQRWLWFTIALIALVSAIFQLAELRHPTALRIVGLSSCVVLFFLGMRIWWRFRPRD